MSKIIVDFYITESYRKLEKKLEKNDSVGKARTLSVEQQVGKQSSRRLDSFLTKEGSAPNGISSCKKLKVNDKYINIEIIEHVKLPCIRIDLKDVKLFTNSTPMIHVLYYTDINEIEVAKCSDYKLLKYIRYYVSNVSYNEKEIYEKILYKACKFYNKMMVEFTLNELDSKCIYKNLCLLYSKMDLNSKLVKIFIERMWNRCDYETFIKLCGFDNDNGNNYPKSDEFIKRVIRRQDIETIGFLLDFNEYNYEFDCYYLDHREIMAMAITHSSTKVVKFMADERCTMNLDYIEIACDNDNVKMCQFILKNAEYDNKELNKMFLSCTSECCPDIFDLFVQHGANLKKYGKDIQQKAKENDNDELVEHLEKLIHKSS